MDRDVEKLLMKRIDKQCIYEGKEFSFATEFADKEVFWLNIKFSALL